MENLISSKTEGNNSILKIGIYKLINSAKDKIENSVAEQKEKQGQTDKREKL